MKTVNGFNDKVNIDLKVNEFSRVVDKDSGKG